MQREQPRCHQSKSQWDQIYSKNTAAKIYSNSALITITMQPNNILASSHDWHATDGNAHGHTNATTTSNTNNVTISRTSYVTTSRTNYVTITICNHANNNTGTDPSHDIPILRHVQ